MTDALRDELHRIGDGAPRAAVPGDLWRQGRRARRRDRLVAGGAVLSLLVVLGGIGLILGLPGRDALPVQPTTGGGEGAVPATLHAVPDRLVASQNEGGWAWREEAVSDRLDVGRASVAFATGTYSAMPVVVTAADGRYHLLDLPGWFGSGSDIWSVWQHDAPLALSPDGTKLAYGWWDPQGQKRGRTMSAGIAVLDLETGALGRTSLADGDHAVAVDRLVWSPDSRWLGWQGIATRGWSAAEMDDGERLAGRLDDAGISRTVGRWGTGSAARALAVTNAGWVVTTSYDAGWSVWKGDGSANDGHVNVASGGPWPPETARASSDPERTWQPEGSAAASPDGSLVAVGTDSVGDGTAVDAWFIAAADGRKLRRPMADDTGIYPKGAAARPLGWLDDDLVVAMIKPGDDSPQTGYDGPHLAVMTAPTVPRDDWTFRVATRLEPGFARAESVTVAVDLMSLNHPTRDFPAPEWPWSDERKVAVFGSLALAVLALLALGLGYRRGRRLR